MIPITLVGQGLMLPLVIRTIGLAHAASISCEPQPPGEAFLDINSVDRFIAVLHCIVQPPASLKTLSQPAASAT